jgi:hypothetical protein
VIFYILTGRTTEFCQCQKCKKCVLVERHFLPSAPNSPCRQDHKLQSSPAYLKGLCHEINNFSEGPKSQISTLYIYMRLWSLNFFGALLWRKWKFKFLLASMKTPSNFLRSLLKPSSKCLLRHSGSRL